MICVSLLLLDSSHCDFIVKDSLAFGLVLFVPVRNEQICNRSVLTKTDQVQTTLSSAESVFSLLQTLSLNTLRDVNAADAKQTNKRSADYLQRLQMICNSLKPKKRYNICELLTAHLLFDT